MTASANRTVERIMDSAQLMVQQRGFHAFSYRDIAAEIGIRAASIHYHFPTKSGLAGAVLDRIMLRFTDALERFEHIDGHASRLQHFCAVFLNTFDRGDRLCPFCMVATAQNALPADLHARVTRFWRLAEDWLEALLVDGAARDAFTLQRDARTTAQVMLAALEGGMVTARAFGDRDRFIALADHLVAAVLPAGAKPGSVADVQYNHAPGTSGHRPPGPASRQGASPATGTVQTRRRI